MISVTIQTESEFSAGKPQLLFEGHHETGNGFVPNYDADLEGRRFLMIKANEEKSEPTQLNVVLGWIRNLEDRVPSPRR